MSLIALDEESGKERKTNSYLLVQANDINEAFDNTTSAMANTMGDYSIPSITESLILYVFHISAEMKGSWAILRFRKKPQLPKQKVWKLRKPWYKIFLFPAGFCRIGGEGRQNSALFRSPFEIP